MSERTLPNPDSKHTVWLALGLIAAVLVLHLPLRAHYLYEWDSVQLALGAQEFNIHKHPPHPPGYPLWVMMVRGLSTLLDDANLAQIVLALAFTAAGAFFFVLLGRQVMGRGAVLFGCALLLLSPPVQLYSVTATTYPANLFTSALMGWLAARLWRGQSELGPAAAAAWSLCAGVSTGGALLTAPLLAVALFRCGGLRWQFWLPVVSAGALAGLSWHVPMALSQGGWSVPLQSFRALSRLMFSQTSVLCGASAGAHLRSALSALAWLGMALAAPAVIAVLGARMARGTPKPAQAAEPAWNRPLFYVLWAGPNLLYVLALHCPKPGYLLTALVPLVLGAALWIARSAARIEAVSLRKARLTADASLFILLSLSLTLALYPFQQWFQRPGKSLWRALSCSSLRDIETADQAVEKVQMMARSGGGAGENVVFVLCQSNTGPNWRKLMYYLPETPVCTFLNGRIARAFSYHSAESEELHAEPDVKRIFWIWRNEVLPEAVFRAFPETHHAWEGAAFSVWQSDWASDAPEVLLNWDGRTHRFVRDRK